MRGSGREGAGRDGAARDGGGAGNESGGRKVSRMGKVYKLVDGKPVGVPVRLGLGDSQRTEVLEGINENDAVVVGESGAGPGGANRSPMAPGGPPGGGGMRRGF
jgi:hypothetical protein